MASVPPLMSSGGVAIRQPQPPHSRAGLHTRESGEVDPARSTRTVPEMEKVLEELTGLMEYRKKEMGEAHQPILALGLSSRKNMCVHPDVMDEGSRESVDAKCRSLTASWVRERHEKDPSVPVCSFFEEYERQGAEVNGRGPGGEPPMRLWCTLCYPSHVSQALVLSLDRRPCWRLGCTRWRI